MKAIEKAESPTADVRMGSRVWVGIINSPRDYLYKVIGLTLTQIVVQRGSGEIRFRRDNGWRIPRRFDRQRITGVATEEECRQFDAVVEEENRKSSLERERHEAYERKRSELCNLLPDGSYTNRDTENGDKWELTVSNLTEEQLRSLAPLVKSVIVSA
jgi:hypothetical protein